MKSLKKLLCSYSLLNFALCLLIFQCNRSHGAEKVRLPEACPQNNCVKNDSEIPNANTSHESASASRKSVDPTTKQHKTTDYKKNAKRRLKILVSAPAWGWSHMKFQSALADTLIEAGHDVHIFTFSVNPAIGNATATEKVTKFYRHERPADKMDALTNTKIAMDQFSGPKNFIWHGIWQNLIEMLADACPEIIANEELLGRLRSENYDFGISESYEVCMFGVFHLIGIRSMAASQAVATGTQLGQHFGVPTFSSFVHGTWTFSTNPAQMTFLDRALNLFNDIYEYYDIRHFSYRLEQPMFDAAFGVQNAPNLRAIMRNVSLAFVNSHEFFSMPRPISHKMIYVAGIVDEEMKQISPEIESIINRSADGVILFSFGSFADTRKMDVSLRNAFLEAFAKLPQYQIIWKFTAFENDTFPIPANVHLFDWMPQPAILAHPKTKALITHCGLNSINEAAKFGVPMLAIPLFAEQPFNAATLVSRGVGIKLDIRKISDEGAQAVELALRQLLTDRRFAENAKLVSQKIETSPFGPKERLVKWVEFAAQFPELNELNMPTEMGFVAYYCLDVIFVAICAIIAIIVEMIVIVAYLCHLFSYLYRNFIMKIKQA